MRLPVDAPIPGANMTADTRNYPWHRPPEYTDYDEAVQYLIGKVSEPDQHDLVMSLVELKLDVTSAVTAMLLQAVSKGKIAIDLAILVAGPVVRYIDIMAKDAGLSPKLIVEDRKPKITPTALKLSMGIMDADDMAEMPPQAPETAAERPTGGLMGAPTEQSEMVAPAEEQSAMLGMENTEEEPVDGLA